MKNTEKKGDAFLPCGNGEADCRLCAFEKPLGGCGKEGALNKNGKGREDDDF